MSYFTLNEENVIHKTKRLMILCHQYNTGKNCNIHQTKENE